MNITFITGAANGLGESFAKLYAKDNNNLLLVDIDESNLLRVKNEISSLYPTIFIETLVADLEAVKNPEDKAPEVVVKADEKAKSSIIMTIMDAAQDAQYKKLIVAGEPLNKKDQRKLEEAQKVDTKSLTSNNVINGATTPLPQETQYENWSE